MDNYETPRKRSSKVRERRQARKKRRQAMATLRQDGTTGITSKIPHIPVVSDHPEKVNHILSIIRDGIWYILRHTPVLPIIGGLIGFLFLIFVATHLLSGRIFPNVWLMDIPLGGLTVEEAETQITMAWDNKLRIQIKADNDALVAISPSELGIEIDALATAEAARNAGLSGVPFGHGIDPIIKFNTATAQNYLLNLTDHVNKLPQEASYQWTGGQLVGVEGKDGRALDVLASLDTLENQAVAIVDSQQFILMTDPIPPTVRDPSPYINDVYKLTSKPFRLTGYDPFVNEYLPWQANGEEVARWIAAGPGALIIKENAFEGFINALNGLLAQDARPRYVDMKETMARVEAAVNAGETEVELRVRYRESLYAAEAGDVGFLIGRKMGMPFLLIDEANPTMNWNAISIGQEIVIPSRDQLLPEPIVRNKRIVVDLDTRWLVAYENDEVVFDWEISIGRTDAPSNPGIFQILTRDEVAYGSGFSLCNETFDECGQWEMSWFMGMYEVFPGLMNGFHGAVLLPNGGYLDGGQTGNASTFGCVMSRDDNAQRLYEWAEVGVIVEVISREFAPQSDLGRAAKDYINSKTQI